MPPRAALQRGNTFTRTFEAGVDFLSTLPRCGWKLLVIVVALMLALFCVGSSFTVAFLWAFGGQTFRLSVPDIVPKGAGTDVV